ncbi:copper chaperone PCu(A)C [Nocardioides pacificus]
MQHHTTPALTALRSRARHRARLRVLGVPLAVLALTLGATACGDDDATSTGPATSSAAATPADSSADASATEVTVEDPWVRATTDADDTTMTGAFMLLRNGGAEDATLVSATSPVAKMVQLHEMVMKDGAMAMAEVEDGIVITAGRGKVLEPGGYHVMLMGLTQELAAGDEVELTLELSDGTSIDVTAPVKEFTEEEGHYHSPDQGEHSH